jgi:hypothetical protein
MEDHMKTVSDSKSLILRTCLIFAGIAIVGAVMLIAEVVQKKHSFVAGSEFHFFKRSEAGKWEEFDSVAVQGIQFEGNVTDLAPGKKRATSAFVWSGPTKKGKVASTRLQNAEATIGPSGSSQFDFDGVLTYDGKAAKLLLHTTTGTISAPDGNHSGAPLQILNGEQTARFVGTTTFRIPLGNQPPEEVLLLFVGGAKAREVK